MKTGTWQMSTKLWITALMTVFYLGALGCRLTGAVPHEWLGLAFFGLSALHLAVNHRWYKRIHKGKYTFRRCCNTVFNLLLPVVMAALCVTGIMNSRHVFGFLNLKGGMDIRQLHSLSAYWGIVLLGIHTGLQWMRVLPVIGRLTGLAARSRLNVSAALLLAGYGVWASFDREMGSKLFLGFGFDFWDAARPAFLFFTHNLAILALYATVTHYALKFLRNAGAPANMPVAEPLGH